MIHKNNVDFMSFALQIRPWGTGDLELQRIRSCFEIARQTGIYLCYYERPETANCEDDEYETMHQIVNHLMYRGCL